MKKIILILLALSFGIIILYKTESYAYTISNQGTNYYNQTTETVGTADMFDVSSNMIEFIYYDLGSQNVAPTSPIRVVFSNAITTEVLPIINPSAFNLAKIEIELYTSTNILLYQHISYFASSTSLSYFETNFTTGINIITLDYILIRISNLAPYDELQAVQSMHGAIIVAGSGMIINQTISTIQYTNGWMDAMNSKVTQIWSLWGNIFDTFMSVFDIFSIQLVGDITIGHIALVPLVLGLIGFIYALGGKRGR